MRAHEEWVEPGAWLGRCAELAGSGATMLDMLAAVDDPPAGSIEVLVHVVDVDRGVRHLLRTRVDREDPRVDSLVGLFPGAAWHEREAHEMFGVGFEGHPGLRPLLTGGDAGFPLRRTTPLPVRAQTPWPGASEPAQRPAGDRVATRPRTRPTPPGIPAQWLTEDGQQG